MASGWTNRGKKLVLDNFFRGTAISGTNLAVALVTSAAAPTVDTNTLSELTEIAAGNGYTTGGYNLTRNSTDFDTISEDDTNDLAHVLAKDVTWTAGGGSIPPSGDGARYAVLTDQNATIGSRQVLAWWDLLSDITKTVGQTLTLSDLKLRIKEC